MHKTWILVELEQPLYAFSQQTLVTSCKTALFLRWTQVLSGATLFELTLDNCFWFCCALCFKGGSCPDARKAAARARVSRPPSSPAFGITLFSLFISANNLNRRKQYNIGVNPASKKTKSWESKSSRIHNAGVYYFSSEATFRSGSATWHQENKLHLKLLSNLIKIWSFKKPNFTWSVHTWVHIKVLNSLADINRNPVSRGKETNPLILSRLKKKKNQSLSK